MDMHLDTLLNLPNTTVEFCTRQSNDVCLSLRFLNESAACLHCQQVSSELHQTRPMMVRDLSVFGQATYLKVPRRQFYCSHCQRYFTESLEFVEEERHSTQRYEQYIYQQVQQSSIEQVSRVEELSSERIQGIFKHQYAQGKKRVGKGLNESGSTKLASAKGNKTSSRLSGTLKLENWSK